jgi:predicted transcriptional regulator
METTILTATIPLPLAERVGLAATRLERSPEWIMEQALAEWIDREERRRQLTLEALADVDAGTLIEHAAVKAWAEGLGGDNPGPVPTPG